MELRTFFGILPPDLGFSRERLSVEILPVPERAVLFIPRGNDRAGSPSLSVGDPVAVGQPLTGDDPPATSPVAGKVSGLKELVWTNGEAFFVVEVATSEDDAAGGGATGEALPTGDAVIVNGLESDLLVTVNRQVILDSAGDLRAGVALLAERGVKTIVVAVPEDLRGALGQVAGAEVVTIPANHPNGHPEILARLVARSVPAADGAVTISAEALAAAGRGGSGGQAPEKLVTFSGTGGVPERVFKVRVGTPVGDVLDAAGVTMPEGGRVVLGGALTGRAAFDLDFPVMEDIDAVYVQGPGQTGNVSASQCINCGKCVGVCPNRLPVNLLSRYAEHSLFEKTGELDAERCIECGLCAYVCTAQRPIVHFIQHAKNEIRKLREAQT